MKASTMNTFQRGLSGARESMISARPLRITAIAVGVLLAAYLASVVSATPRQGAQHDLGAFAPVVSHFDNQFDPLEVDLSLQQLSTAQALIDETPGARALATRLKNHM